MQNNISTQRNISDSSSSAEHLISDLVDQIIRMEDITERLNNLNHRIDDPKDSNKDSNKESNPDSIKLFNGGHLSNIEDIIRRITTLNDSIIANIQKLETHF